MGKLTPTNGTQRAQLTCGHAGYTLLPHDQAVAESASSDEVTAAVADAAPADDELTRLLASIDQPAEQTTAEETADEAPMDPELAALLKSLG